MGTEQEVRAARGQVDAGAAHVYEEFFVPALFAAWADPVVEAAAVGPGDRVLDVGCGTGVLARAAVRRAGTTGQVVGLDPNDGMLEVARTTTSAVQWHRGAAEQLPFDDASFDRVVSQFALVFCTDRRQAVTEMARVLRPGGTVAVATWASLTDSPGYAALVDLLDEVVGGSAASALTVPFGLGDPEQMHGLVAAAFPDVRVTRRAGLARFPSVDSWVRTEIRGWTLADMVSPEQLDAVVSVARARLSRFVTRRGTVVFAAPALVATGTAPGQ